MFVTMKKVILILLIYCIETNGASAQFTFNTGSLSKIEIFYTPFQTRIGGLEYDEITVNRELSRPNYKYSDAHYFKTIDFEIGLNYRFIIWKKQFGIGASFYRDSYVFELTDVFRSLRYQFEDKGLSINLFYSKPVMQNTTVEIGINSRLRLKFKENLSDYDYQLSIVGPEYKSKLAIPFFLSFVPRISFQTEVYNNFHLNYGMLLKFWGRNTFNATSASRSNPDEKYLDVNLNNSVFKTYIGLSYKF